MAQICVMWLLKREFCCSLDPPIVPGFGLLVDHLAGWLLMRLDCD